MNVLDWIFVALIFLLGARCMARGFIAEVLSVASVALGLLAALLLYKGAAALLRDKLGVTTLPEVLAFAAIFGRAEAQVHVEYAPPGLGRIAFGGRLSK